MRDQKQHTTNYFNTFLEVAEDTKVSGGTIPPSKKEIPTIAQSHYTLMHDHPYHYTSDDIVFLTFANRSDIPSSSHKAAREQFFSKGQPCLRTSPLTKNYGFGIHFDTEGKVALYGMETEEYNKFTSDPSLKKIKAIRTSRKPI